MRRTLAILAVMAMLAGCAMWQRTPEDDPATPINEAEEHEKKVAGEIAKIEAGSKVAGAVVPPPWDLLISLGTQLVLGGSAMIRGKK